MVRDAANSTAAAANARTGMIYMALCRPVALERLGHDARARVRHGLGGKVIAQRPVAHGPMLAPRMYMKQKYMRHRHAAQTRFDHILNGGVHGGVVDDTW